MEFPSWKNRYGSNTIINNFGEFSEMIIYKNPFAIPNQDWFNKRIDRSRKFYYEDNILKPKYGATIEKLQESLIDSRKRAVDNIYGYGLSNEWDYFMTLTFDHSKVNRDNDEDVKYAWKKFKLKMQYLFPDIKILLVPEYHSDEIHLHFHGLVGNCNLDNYLIPSINNGKTYYNPIQHKTINHGDQLFTDFGDQRFEFKSNFYEYGFTELVKIRKDSNRFQILNYLNKYISKDNVQMKYNRKSYYRTHNLDFKNKQVLSLSKEELNSMINSFSLFEDFNFKKETDKFFVYTFKNIKIENNKN